MESAGSQNMTRGAGTCWQQEDDDGFQIWLEPPRDNQKPFTDSERAQRWRLSLASLLFLTILLSDHLWFCAEATLARTRDKFASTHPLSPQTYSAHSSLRGNPDDIFIGNSTKHLWRLETCHRDSLSNDCFTFLDADELCRGLSDREGTRAVNMSNLYLSFCNSYSLLDLLYGSTSPDNLNCSLDALGDGDANRCSLCVQAYQRYDQHAQEKYEDFELLTQKYEPGAYSVRTCMEQCKVGCKQTNKTCKKREETNKQTKGMGWEGVGERGVMWWWPSVDLGPDRCQFVVLLLLLLLSPWRRVTDSRRLPAPGLMFIHLLIVFRPHANVQMEAVCARPIPTVLPFTSLCTS